MGGAESRGPRGRGEVVLVVDDEPLVLDFMALVLREHGYTVQAAHGGAEALEALDQRTIDLLVTDVRMPGVNGVELATRVREQRADIGIVFVSGHAGGLLDGFLATNSRVVLLRKPFQTPELLVAMRMLLSGR